MLSLDELTPKPASCEALSAGMHCECATQDNRPATRQLTTFVGVSLQDPILAIVRVQKCMLW